MNKEQIVESNVEPMLSAVVRAELKPLSGKYYGTYVELFDKDNNSLGEVKFWFPTREYGKEYVSPREKEHVIKDCDDEWYLDWDWTHSENLFTYEVAMLFVNAVNNSRQSYCTCSRAKGLDHDEEGVPYCVECEKPVK